MLLRPSNVYSFVQRVTDDLSKSPSEAMHYGTDHIVQQLKSIVFGYHNDLEAIALKATHQQIELSRMEEQLHVAKLALFDITNKLDNAVRQWDIARKKQQKVESKLEAVYVDSVRYELLEKVDHLSAEVDSLKSSNAEMSNPSTESLFCFNTRDEGGHAYSTAVREWYYELLANGMPPPKIPYTIKSVVKTFFRLSTYNS